MSERRTALVTGASRGIGLAIALTLAEAGWDVAVTGRTVSEGEGSVPARTQREGEVKYAVPGSLDATCERIAAHNARALPVPMDLTDADSVRSAAAQVLETWGSPDLVVNNAVHHLPHARLLELDAQTLADSLLSNHVHQVVFVQSLLPAMVAAGGGTFVNLVSGSVVNEPPAPPGEGGWGLAYSSAKAAFGRLSGAINAEYAGAGVRAFNLDPGFVVTEAAAVRGGTDKIAEKGFATTPPEAAGRAVRWITEHPAAAANLGKLIRANDFV